MKLLLSILALLALVLSSCANLPGGVQASTPTGPVAEPGTEDSIEIVGGDEESYRDFIRQWIVPVYPDGTRQNVRVYIGSTPADLPYELPVPAGARVIGSITGSWVDYILIYESGLSPEGVHEFYAQALKDEGWQESPTSQGSGFISGADLYKAYCYGEDEASLSVETPSGSAGGTSLRLSLDTSPDSYACNPLPSGGPDLMSLIPALRAPSDVMVQGSGAGSSDRDANVSANLTGDVSAAEVADFYQEQLLAAGWQLQGEGDGEGAAWSRWMFQDDEGDGWTGALMVVEVSAENNSLFALVTIEKDR